MIPNRAGRWSSVVYILIGLAGAYGLLTDLAWPEFVKVIEASGS